MVRALIIATLSITVIVGSAAAQIEDRLAINVGVPSATATPLCNSQGARLFYDALDDAQDLLDSIPDLSGRETEIMWTRSYDRWGAEYFDPVPADLNCLPALVNLVAVDWLITERSIEHYVGDLGKVEAERLVPLMHQMARLDLPTLNAGPTEPHELVLNQPYLQMPNCSIAQAQAFYETINSYTEQTERLELVNDRTSLRRWMAGFERWIAEHWSPFYEQPCGWVLFMTVYGAYAAYSDGYNLAVQREDSSLRVMSHVLLHTYWDVDAAILELAEDYALTETEDTPVEQPSVLEAAVDLYTGFRAPDVAIIQILVDAYLNRTGDNP